MSKTGLGTAILSGTPTNQHANQYFQVSLIVTDKAGAIAKQTGTIFVNNVNDLPVFISTPNFDVTENQLYEYVLKIKDDDLSISNPTENTFVSVSSLPSWLSVSNITNTSLKISGTLFLIQGQTFSIHTKATDNKNL